MLKLIDVCKSYKFGNEKCLVLDKVNLDFKKQELVFVLGKSGSGKSTLLNVIGGLLEVDSGKILLDDKDITTFSNSMLCNYRNNMVGNIFQEYHLVEYMTVVDNIKLGQTIRTDKARIEAVLRELGIYSKRNVKVNRLSGGEKQRVAIARAIVNNPDIILCDEPTGALDSVNSIKIMNILKKIAKDKLVIVVSHDEMLANKYANRIVRIVDGKVDYIPQVDSGKFGEIEQKRLSKFALFKLALKNLGLKKGRTLFTSLAISLGFICILVVMCLSKSFHEEIEAVEHAVVSMFPISISNGDFAIVDAAVPSSSDKIVRKKKSDSVVTNKIDRNYIEYVKNIASVSYIGYEYDVVMPLVSSCYKKVDDRYVQVFSDRHFIDSNYVILYGRNVMGPYDIVLKVDSHNRVEEDLLDVFGIEEDVAYEELVGRKLRLIKNDDYFVKEGSYYSIANDYEKLYNQSNIELEIVGIVREREVVDDYSYFYVSQELMDSVLEMNRASRIVLDQLEHEYNVLGMELARDDLLSYLGYGTLPSRINIYVASLEDKEKVVASLDAYNLHNEKMVYVDTMREAIAILKDVLQIVTFVLLAFSTVSLLVGVQMVFILTNNRVMERIKEIGILRSLGARRGDITTLFNLENFVIGVLSSFLGVVVLYLLVHPINSLLEAFLGDNGGFAVYKNLVIIAVFVHIFIVVFSGYIPSKIAGRRKIIDCLSFR